MKNVKAGDTITIANGDYKDFVLNYNPSSNGTSEKCILLKSETPGMVRLSGSSKIMIGGDFLLVDGFLFEGKCTLEAKENVIDFRVKTEHSFKEANHSRVTNCAIIDYTLTEESNKDNYFVNMVGLNNELDHCYFTGKTNKGPTVVVEYQQGNGYVPGSNVAPSTFHRIHHNYFGYRTFSSNGGEQLRVGTSTTSFSRGFNTIEYNYFENEQIEAEVISNKSWNNIYRYNTFFGNDGALVIRHGQECIVYGNYINGKAGRNASGGLRVINANNTVFNNYLENLEGGKETLKAPITIMAGLLKSELNEYYPADSAIIAFNTVVNSVGPAINLGVGNSSKGKPFTAPKNILLTGNLIINTGGNNTSPVIISNPEATYHSENNFHTNGNTSVSGFARISEKDINSKNGKYHSLKKTNPEIISLINNRLLKHNLRLTDDEICNFDFKKIVSKNDVGPKWMKNTK